MATLRGKATRLRNTANHAGGNGGTTHITIFQINDKVVRVASYEPIIINSGDEVAVAGKYRNGVFDAQAYKNITLEVTGNSGARLFSVLGLCLMIGGIFAMITMLKDYFDINPAFRYEIPFSYFPIVFGGIFLSIGIFLIIKGIKIYSHSKEIE